MVTSLNSTLVCGVISMVMDELRIIGLLKLPTAAFLAKLNFLL
jgi:hypothetical protein